MIIQTCPYTKESKPDPYIACSLGKVNIAAVHVAKKDFVPCHTAPLSVKFVLSGAEMYECENHQLSVDPFKYLIINKNYSYSSAIDSSIPTTSFCIFFSDRFISDGYRFASQSNEYLLDNVRDQALHEINFNQKLYWRNNKINILLNSFSAARGSNSQREDLLIDEFCSQLLQLLLITHENEKLRWGGLKSIKISTRQELYKRLSYSIDFIHEYYSTSISLAQLSKVSCLSSFHFLRAFKQAFKITPRLYITTIRLQHACRLLQQPDLTVSDIGVACGYQDESSFIRLFKTHLGVTPITFRKQFTSA